MNNYRTKLKMDIFKIKEILFNATIKFPTKL